MSDPRPIPLTQPDAPWIGSFTLQAGPTGFTPWKSRLDEQPAACGDDEAAQTEPEEVVEIDPAAIRADSFAQGFEEGRRTVQLEFADERAALAQLAQSLEALRPEPTNALAALLAETVERLVRQIVGSAEIDAVLLQNRAEEAAALIGEEVEPARLLLHPDDIPLLSAARIPVDLAADPSLTRGSIVLECGEGWIEDGPAVRLDRLRAALDRMGAPE